MGNTSSRDVPPDDVSSAGNDASTSSRESATTRSRLVHLNRAVNKFAIYLYQEMLKDQRRENVVACPLGVAVGLGLLLLGAEGKTRDEIWRTLYLQEIADNADLMAPFAAMHFDSLLSCVEKGCLFQMAVRVFAPRGIKMTHDYEDICTQFELTKVHNIDFTSDVSKAIDDVNNWVREKTHGVIPLALPQNGVIKPETRLLLLCANHIKVRWRDTFDSSKTVTSTFHVNARDTLQVRVMQRRCELNYIYSDKLDADIVELPFENRYTCLYVLLPRKREGITQLEKQLARTMLEQTFGEMLPEVVDLLLPRFTFESQLQLNDKLKALGIRELFSPNKANLSFLSAEKIHVTSVFQHVHFEYEECESCNTSAATIAHLAVPSPGSAAQAQPEQHEIVTFHADHPFVFIVRDVRTGSIWLIGRVFKPEVA